MAITAGTLATFAAIGNREDLTDMIYRIDPTDTPFVTGAERETAKAVKHEWQTQALAAAAANAQLEGDDSYAPDAVSVTVRLSNVCQISRKTAQVSGTQRAVEHAGRGDELAYQEMLKGLELKRDIEFNLVGVNQAQIAGDTTTARKTSSILSWLKSNESTSGTAPSVSGTNSRADGTQRAFTEAQLKTVLSSIWTNGGKPDTIMTGAFNKQAFSTFTGRATPIEDTKSKSIIASVDAYESDFGKLKVVANRFSRSRDCLILQMDMWAVAYLQGRKFVSIPLAKIGDSDRKSIISEYSLVSRNEKASGGVFDLTTA